MKKIITLLPLLLIVTVLIGCSVSTAGLEQVSAIDDNITASNGLPVELFYVKSKAIYPYQGGAEGWMTGYIEIENLAYEKEVIVHWTEIHSSTWNDTAAYYVKTLESGKELWAFETPAVEFTPRLSADFKFAIKYAVNGTEYWDNNGSADYKISVGPRPLYTTDIVLGKSMITMEKYSVIPGFFNVPAYFTGTVLLENLAYDKDVIIIWTDDNWDTVNDSPATYMQPQGDNCEKWTFQIDLGGGYGYYPTIRFAVLYQVNGGEIWDNNFEDNYNTSN
jgi:hypothetical protein